MADLTFLSLTIAPPMQHFNALAFMEKLNSPASGDNCTLVAGTVAKQLTAQPDGKVELASDRLPEGWDSPLAPLYGEIVGLLERETTPLEDRLREWVDGWLDGGRLQDGREDATKRHDTPKIQIIARGWCAHFVRPLFLYDQLGVLLDIRYEDSDDIYAPLIPRWETANDYAAQLVAFLASDFRFQLAKCRRCGVYFALPDRHVVYRHGTICDDCRDAARATSALEITADNRKKAKTQLYNLAATHFGKKIRANARWYEDHDLVPEIVTMLNKEILRIELLRKVYRAAPRQGITAKWLSWAVNRIAITEAAQKASQPAPPGLVVKATPRKPAALPAAKLRVRPISH